MTIQIGSNAFNPGVTQTPASNTNAVCTLAAPTTGRWRINQIRWSYSAVPTMATLIISWTDPTAGALSETYYVSAGGPGFLLFENQNFPVGVAVTLTLLAGGGGILGSIYADARVVP